MIKLIIIVILENFFKVRLHLVEIYIFILKPNFKNLYIQSIKNIFIELGLKILIFGQTLTYEDKVRI